LDFTHFSETPCKVWVLIDNPENYWWKKIDFHSGFLLSEIKNHKKQSRPTELQQIIDLTKWPAKEFQSDYSSTIIFCKNHFHADWIYLIHDAKTFKQSKLIEFLNDTNLKSIRCFAPFEPEPSLKSRLDLCDLVSEAHLS